MESVDSMLAEFDRRSPASLEVLDACETQLGFSLPPDYREFLRVMDGGEGFLGPNSYLMLWSANEVALNHAGYETEANAPGCLLFGSNGGGDAYGFDRRSPQIRIVQIPFIVLDWGDAVVLSQSFDGFLKALYEA